VKTLSLIALTIAAVFLMIPVLIGASAGTSATLTACETQPSSSATAGIPANYLALYQQAGQQYGIPWQILAAVGRAESTHGTDNSAGIHSGANSAGAMGPMQMKADEWKLYGVDGNGDGIKNVHDPADAIPAAAAKLRHDGAPQYLRQALWHYNPAGWYVDKILRYANQYAAGQSIETLAQASGSGSGCTDPTATISGAASAKALGAIRAALTKLGRPYVWGATGPGSFDCSGLVVWAYAQVGIHLPHYTGDLWNTGHHITRDQLQPGDLVFFYANHDHVGIYLGNGNMVNAPHTGDVVRQASLNGRPYVGAVRVT